MEKRYRYSAIRSPRKKLANDERRHNLDKKEIAFNDVKLKALAHN